MMIMHSMFDDDGDCGGDDDDGGGGSDSAFKRPWEINFL